MRASRHSSHERGDAVPEDPHPHEEPDTAPVPDETYPDEAYKPGGDEPPPTTEPAGDDDGS
jgi:hypothetical protein